MHHWLLPPNLGQSRVECQSTWYIVCDLNVINRRFSLVGYGNGEGDVITGPPPCCFVLA